MVSPSPLQPRVYAQIRVRRLNLGSEVFVEGHAPETVVLRLSGGVQLFPNYIGGLQELWFSREKTGRQWTY
jgi:hypothetical protein